VTGNVRPYRLRGSFVLLPRVDLSLAHVPKRLGHSIAAHARHDAEAIPGGAGEVRDAQGTQPDGGAGAAG
jgi:hypothetical protein